MDVHFKIQKSTSREKLLEFITSAAVADSDADVEAYLKVLNPVEDRRVMGEAFEATLGYNPITSFDFNDLVKIVDEATVEADSVLAPLLKGRKEQIIDRAMELFELRRESQLKKCVAIAASELLGDLGDSVAELLGVSLESGSSSDDEDKDEDDIDVFDLEDDRPHSEPIDEEEFIDDLSAIDDEEDDYE